MLRALLVFGSVALGLATLRWAHPGVTLHADPALARLLRGMALIKAALVLAGMAVVGWRFGRPLPMRYAAVYLGGLWTLVAAVTLIWQVTAVGAAAALFDVATLTLLVAAWGDDRFAVL
jgi:hypothetical protein